MEGSVGWSLPNKYLFARSLTSPPTDDGIMTVDFNINSLPGNPVNVSDYITIQPNRIIFTAQNYSSEANIAVDTASALLALP
jgi:hypothetical protein